MSFLTRAAARTVGTGTSGLTSRVADHLQAMKESFTGCIGHSVTASGVWFSWMIGAIIAEGRLRAASTVGLSRDDVLADLATSRQAMESTTRRSSTCSGHFARAASGSSYRPTTWTSSPAGL